MDKGWRHKDSETDRQSLEHGYQEQANKKRENRENRLYPDFLTNGAFISTNAGAVVPVVVLKREGIITEEEDISKFKGLLGRDFGNQKCC